MLVIFLMALTAAVTGHMVLYLSGEVAVRLGYEREVGHRVAGSAALSLIANPKKRNAG